MNKIYFLQQLVISLTSFLKRFRNLLELAVSFESLEHHFDNGRNLIVTNGAPLKMAYNYLIRFLLHRNDGRMMQGYVETDFNPSLVYPQFAMEIRRINIHLYSYVGFQQDVGIVNRGSPLLRRKQLKAISYTSIYIHS